MRRIFAISTFLVILLLCPLSTYCGQSELLYGATIYIKASDPSLRGMLEAELQKRKLPLMIADAPGDASYILVAYVQSAGSPAAPISGPRNMKTTWEGRAVLANAQTRAIAWNASFRGVCKPCDASEAKADQVFALKFAKRLQKDLYEGRSISDRIDDIIAP